MRIIVPVKRVPDTASARRIDPASNTVDRESTEAVLCPVNEYAIEEAVRIKERTDARTSVVPAAVAELLGLPSITYARHLELTDGGLVAHREHEEGWDVVSAPLPAIVSVVEAINEPRFPSFKGIIAAKSKPVVDLDLAAIGLEPALVGAGAAAAELLDFSERPPKAAGTIVTDDGSGSSIGALVDWMAERKFV
jgi:electron transfer flavoprotein beta subunit